MAITIDTKRFTLTHGKAPKGTGQWMFERQASHGLEVQTFTSPVMSFREASAWVKKQVRAEGFQDASVFVMP